MMVKNIGEDKIDKTTEKLEKRRNSIGKREGQIVKHERKLHSGVRSADNSQAPGSKAIAQLNKVKKNTRTSSLSSQPSTPSVLLSSPKLTDSLSIDVTSVSSTPNVEFPLNTDTCPCGVSDKTSGKLIVPNVADIGTQAV